LNESLLNLLRYSGYILYARHGEATVGEDQPYLDFNNCYTQRNLSELGRRQAIYYGEVIRNLKIPVNNPILASPYCRTIETAELAFGTAYVSDPFLYEINLLNENPTLPELTRILNTLNYRLEIAPPQGSNQVLIAHSFPDDIGLGQIPYMGTVIVKPFGRENGYKVVAKLSLGELAGLS
jgi:hypothetical protein